MRKTLLFIMLLLLLTSCEHSVSDSKHRKVLNSVDENLRHAVELCEELTTDKYVSPRTIENDKIKMVPSKDWTSGFFPGELWMMYQLTGDEYWKTKAIQFTMPLEQEKFNGKTHDMGFKMYNSFGKAYEITGDLKYKEILLHSAKTLATRFNPTVGCIRSWDHNSDKWDFPVIIDNMMNLELLFWAAKETGNDMYYNIAVSHANMTLKHHFRNDFSCFHVVDYNPIDGSVQEKTTHQGLSSTSSWSRGQAWALYGYTMMFRETQDSSYLLQADRIADFILNHKNLPKNLIPYWDFDAPNIPNEPLDVSAATIIGSALFELSKYSAKSEHYLTIANQMMRSLTKPSFFNNEETNSCFILNHSTGSVPHNSEIDVPLIYADYYFMEMIYRSTFY